MICDSLRLKVTASDTQPWQQAGTNLSLHFDRRDPNVVFMSDVVKSCCSVPESGELNLMPALCIKTC